MLEQSPIEDREDDLDLIQPRGVGRGELKTPTWMLLQPVFDLLGTAGGEVVGDRDDLLAFHYRDIAVQMIKETDQVKPVASLGGHPDHVSLMNFQAREQALRAIALIFVLPARGLTRLWWTVGLGWRLGLDTGLFIEREDQHVLGRVQ